jgi:hypothetical protein
LQLVLLPEKQLFADADLAAGTDQAFPIIRAGGELAGQQNFDAALEEIASRWIVRTDRLGALAFAAAIEPGWKDPRVVEDDQVAGPQKLRKVAKLRVRPLSGRALQAQHAGSIAGGEGFLGYEFVGKREVKI